MNCQLNDSQIQSWLDGESDESQHLSECPECQQRLLSIQKLRSRMSPPPSPLGRDFARRTAQHVLRVSDVVKPHKPPSGGWLSKLRDNPLTHVVQRERARRFLKLPSLAVILLLYMLPGGYVFQSGEADAIWAYFGMVQIGLTLLLPLFLLSLEWTTLTSLVRGRCLEEMLQTGLEPRLVSDTLALSGLRSLVPALLMIGVALVPVHPQSLLLWLPLTTLAFSAAGYLYQAHLLGFRWPRWLSFLGAGAVAGSLAAPTPWNAVSATVLAGLGYAARRHSIASLTLQQQGRTPAPRRQRGSAWQIWLARRLPDLALLQREMRRRNLFTLSILAGNAGVCLASYTAFGGGAFGWPLLAGMAGLLAAFSLVQREKDSGSYEVLLHSGLRPADFWASAVWIAGLQTLPACLFGAGCSAYRLWNISPLSAAAAALGTGISLFVSLRAGAVIGASIGVSYQNTRQASTRCIQEAALLCVLSITVLGLVAPLVGEGSPLAATLEMIGLSLADALDGVAILPVMLALHLRARALAGSGFGFNPWTYSLALLVPLCLWLQIVNVQFYRYVDRSANSCTGLAILIGLVWAWWASPLARSGGKRRWALLSLSYALTLLVGLPVTAWSLVLVNNDSSRSIAVSLNDVDSTSTLLLVALVAWLVYLLAQRFSWPTPAAIDLRRRSLWAGGAALAVTTIFALGLGRLASAPRPHQAEFDAFLAKNTYPREARSEMQRLVTSISGEGSQLKNPVRDEAKFQSLLSGLLADAAQGTCRDRLDAFWVLSPRAVDALNQHQSTRALELLEQMGLLCRQIETVRPGLSWRLCRQIRVRLMVAVRTQVLTASQLDRLDQLQAHLPDGPAEIRASLDQEAARHYERLLYDRYANYDRQNAVTRFVSQNQAELFLNGYLDGNKEMISGIPYPFSSYQEEGINTERKLLASGNRAVIDIERWKLEHGKYPAVWTHQPKAAHLAYQPTGDGYYLKIWAARAERSPLVLMLQGSHYNLNGSYY